MPFICQYNQKVFHWRKVDTFEKFCDIQISPPEYVHLKYLTENRFRKTKKQRTKCTTARRSCCAFSELPQGHERVNSNNNKFLCASRTTRVQQPWNLQKFQEYKFNYTNEKRKLKQRALTSSKFTWLRIIR